MLLLACCVAALAASAAAAGCELAPAEASGDKLPGDNYYRILINGEVERYVPGERYVVTLVGSRTHSVVQQFTRFTLSLEPLDPAAGRAGRAGRLGQFQLFADTLSQFDETCNNAVVEADDLPKTEVQVMWKAPPAGSGCVLLKAMVFESAARWFAEDGQLTRRVCEDTAATASECCACDDAKYKMVFEGLWSPQTHPKDFPTEALWLTHFSDVIGATHSKNFSFWGEGQIATDGFRALAEWGSPGALEIELRQQAGLRSIVKAPGLWHPRVNSNTSGAFSVDRDRHLLSLVSMFGPSPDWVVGVSGLDLCLKDCSWVAEKVVDLFPYDAGTDNGISYLSPNAETVPREKMSRITAMYPEDPRAPFYNPGGEVAPLARLRLTRDRLVPRACDAQVLQALITEEAEDTQSANRPECAVGEWTAFSACSVTCGKGLRMRTRAYRLPQKAQMFACNRQLVSKEMCVAAVPECAAPAVDAQEPDDVVVPEDPELCATTAWGPWSECSVTCGIGVNTRRRHFINHLGYKRCTLTPVEENRKCMQEACPAAEGADAGGAEDPACPTTPWAGWSPCSASCGRGVRFRTRLLLVPADQQQRCSARVELMQQQPCKEKDDCTFDMLTAKRICMEQPDQGPCRGLYQRWAFAAAKGMCVPFSYGGCRGNGNNFLTSDDCMATCGFIVGGSAPGGSAGPGAPGAPGAASPGAPGAPGAASPGAPTLSSNYPGLSVSSIVPLSNSLTGPVLSSSADCQLTPWSEWSRCSATCGVGFQERTRTVLKQAGPGGAPCPTRTVRRRRCSRQC